MKNKTIKRYIIIILSTLITCVWLGVLLFFLMFGNLVSLLFLLFPLIILILFKRSKEVIYWYLIFLIIFYFSTSIFKEMLWNTILKCPIEHPIDFDCAWYYFSQNFFWWLIGLIIWTLFWYLIYRIYLYRCKLKKHL